MNVNQELIDSYLESDDYYQALATPLKPAKIWKETRRREIEKIFEFKEVHEKVDLAKNLITTEIEDKDLIQNELLDKLDKVEIDDINLEELNIQKLADIPNEPMDLVYDLGSKLIQEEKSTEAEALFTFAMLINPNYPRHWTGLMISYYDNQKYDLAYEAAQVVKQMLPEHPSGYIYSLLSAKFSHPELDLSADKQTVETIFETHPEQKELWANLI